MDRETVARLISKWQKELDECLAWAKGAGDAKLAQSLRSHKQSLESLSRSAEGEIEFAQTDFWPGRTPSSSVCQMVDRMVAKIEKLPLEAMRPCAKRPGGFVPDEKC